MSAHSVFIILYTYVYHRRRFVVFTILHYIIIIWDDGGTVEDNRWRLGPTGRWENGQRQQQQQHHQMRIKVNNITRIYTRAYAYADE